VIPPRDPEAIAAAVLRLCEDRPLRDAMAASAARAAEHYSMAAWEARFVAAVAAV
jgi:glycosyltransferase involved in cell wall biosynthesis